MKKLLLALPLAVLAACGSDKSDVLNKDVIMSADFDSLIGWIPDPSTVTQEKAHSGRYSLKVEPGHDFSLTYSAVLGQLSSTRIRGVKVDAWAYMPNKDAAAMLTFVVKDVAGGKDILNDYLKLPEQVKEYGKWVKVSKEITLPPATNYSSQIVVYLWRAGATGPAYIDDIQLTALR